MEQAYPNISDETRQNLFNKGLRAWKPRPLADWLNPHTNTYWAINGILFITAWVARKHATKMGSPRIFWSTLMCGIPYFAIVSKGKLDNSEDILGKRKTLQDRLEFAPVTRRAFERALQKNTEYQQDLKREIAELEARLVSKTK